MPPKCPQEASKYTQKAPKKPPRDPQEAPKRPQEAPDKVPKGPQETHQKAPKTLSTDSRVRHFGHMVTYHNSNTCLWLLHNPQDGPTTVISF